MNLCNSDLPKEIEDEITSQNDIEIFECSQKGANGYVFFGFNNLIKANVAIKFYYFDSLSNEVERLYHIKHENIADIIGAKTLRNGWACFTMPYYEYGDLDNHMQSNNSDFSNSINITRELLNALSVLHNEPNNLVHRDLKPANILITQRIKPILADFGSVREIDNEKDYTVSSRHAVLYKPPESITNNKYYRASDIYQIGMVMYQMLGGFLPYDFIEWLNKKERNKYEDLDTDYDKSKYVDKIIESKIVNGKLLNLNSLPYYLPTELKKILKKATHKEIFKRYKNTLEFQCALNRVSKIPNWCIDTGIPMIKNINGYDYRIIEKKQGFICEKKSNCGTKWRKYSPISIGDKRIVAEQINQKIR